MLVDKVKGIIYGQAIGDALGTYDSLSLRSSVSGVSVGLATEFMTKKEAALYYGKEGPKEYSQIVHDFHRSRSLQTLFSLSRVLAVPVWGWVQVGEGGLDRRH